MRWRSTPPISWPTFAPCAASTRARVRPSAIELKAPLDVKVAVWEADLELLGARAPELPFLTELEAQLAGLRADRSAAQASAP